MTDINSALRDFAAAVAADANKLEAKLDAAADALKQLKAEAESIINDDLASGAGNTWSIDKIKAYVEQAVAAIPSAATAGSDFLDLAAQYLAARTPLPTPEPVTPQPVAQEPVTSTPSSPPESLPVAPPAPPSGLPPYVTLPVADPTSLTPESPATPAG